MRSMDPDYFIPLSDVRILPVVGALTRFGVHAEYGTIIYYTVQYQNNNTIDTFEIRHSQATKTIIQYNII